MNARLGNVMLIFSDSDYAQCFINYGIAMCYTFFLTNVICLNMNKH